MFQGRRTARGGMIRMSPSEVTVVLPAASSDRISSDLRELTTMLDERDPDATAHGLLGGDNGYGSEFENDVFEMHPFWWGDCECGWEAAEMEWSESHPHASYCYQAELERREDEAGTQGWSPGIAADLASEWGLPSVGCAVHCTCGRSDAFAGWMAANPHPADCPIERPNFRHKRSGFEVRWYKYIGRSMEHVTIDRREWRVIFRECEESLDE